MQARPAPIGECEIVGAAAALHPHRPELRIGTFGLGRLGEAEAELDVEVVGRLNVRREAIDVVDALDARALVCRILLQHRGHAVHLEIEIERHADRIDGAQRAPLKRHVRPRHGQLARGKPFGGLVEILFAGDLEADRERHDVVRFAQDHRVVVALFHAAQIERTLVLVAKRCSRGSPHRTRANCARSDDAELDMARAHDVERRIEDGIAQGHQVPIFGIL